MVGIVKFEFSFVGLEDAGFLGNCLNGRGNYLSVNLDRLGSFREGSEGRIFSFGIGNFKVNVIAVVDLFLLL